MNYITYLFIIHTCSRNTRSEQNQDEHSIYFSVSNNQGVLKSSRMENSVKWNKQREDSNKHGGVYGVDSNGVNSPKSACTL